MISQFRDFRGLVPLINLQKINVAFFYYLGCLLSGVSLIFSIGVHSKKLKWLVLLFHFSCIYLIALFWIVLIIVQSFAFVFIISVFVLPFIVWLKTTNQKWVVLVCLGLPMLTSAVFFIRINYNLITYGIGWNWDIVGFVILLSFSGLVGLILAANLDNTNRKVKWFLLGINYFFATYFHIVILLGSVLRR
ncbi:hypothetical protein ACTNBL_05200 [Enterococcus villorum]|uniref:hypothetical protein n=1 Tax=Enterococcus villorum TaxID=112904 RepID=UPI003F8CCAD3